MIWEFQICYAGRELSSESWWNIWVIFGKYFKNNQTIYTHIGCGHILLDLIWPDITLHEYKNERYGLYAIATVHLMSVQIKSDKVVTDTAALKPGCDLRKKHFFILEAKTTKNSSVTRNIE